MIIKFGRYPFLFFFLTHALNREVSKLSMYAATRNGCVCNAERWNSNRWSPKQ